MQLAATHHMFENGSIISPHVWKWKHNEEQRSVAEFVRLDKEACLCTSASVVAGDSMFYIDFSALEETFTIPVYIVANCLFNSFSWLINWCLEPYPNLFMARERNLCISVQSIHKYVKFSFLKILVGKQSFKMAQGRYQIYIYALFG